MQEIIINYFGMPGNTTSSQLLWLGGFFLGVLGIKFVFVVILEILRGIFK